MDGRLAPYLAQNHVVQDEPHAAAHISGEYRSQWRASPGSDLRPGLRRVAASMMRLARGRSSGGFPVDRPAAPGAARES